MLSEEDKRRIEAEEAYRLEARKRLALESRSPTPKKNHSCLKIGCLSLLAVVGFVVVIRQSILNPPKDSKSPPEKPRVRPADIGLDSFGWRNHRGSAVLQFVLNNTNAYPVKDFYIRCNFDAASGTQLHRVLETLYITIPARSAKSITGFNLGPIPPQVSSADCIVLGYQSFD